MPETAAGLDWAEVLTTMELGLQRLSDDDTDAVTAGALWAVPTVSTPIPPDLVARARAVVERQQEAMRVMREELTATARHLSTLRSIPAAVATGGSVYLDVTG